MPKWLPDLFNVTPWTESTYEQLYEIFCAEIRDHNLKCGSTSVCICQTKTDDKEDIFWHLTTRKEKAQKIPRRKQKVHKNKKIELQQSRSADLRRCERLPWVKPVIENHLDKQVLSWFFLEGDGAIKKYLWLKGHNHVVIMKKIKYKFRLITAFYVDREYTRRQLNKKYENRLK